MLHQTTLFTLLLPLGWGEDKSLPSWMHCLGGPSAGAHGESGVPPLESQPKHGATTPQIKPNILK
jgi:hypothetical protein